MNCPRCGTRNAAGNQFCRDCGMALRPAPPPPAPTSASPEEGLYARIAALRDAQDWDGAIQVCKRLIEKQPTNASAHSILASLYEKRGDLDLALTHREIAEDLTRGRLPSEAPAEPVVRASRTRLRLAVAACVMVVGAASVIWWAVSRPHAPYLAPGATARVPQPTSGTVAQAQSLMARGDYTSAVRVLSQYLQANPNDTQARQMLEQARQAAIRQWNVPPAPSRPNPFADGDAKTAREALMARMYSGKPAVARQYPELEGTSEEDLPPVKEVPQADTTPLPLPEGGKAGEVLPSPPSTEAAATQPRPTRPAGGLQAVPPPAGSVQMQAPAYNPRRPKTPSRTSPGRPTPPPVLPEGGSPGGEVVVPLQGGPGTMSPLFPGAPSSGIAPPGSRPPSVSPGATAPAVSNLAQARTLQQRAYQHKSAGELTQARQDFQAAIAACDRAVAAGEMVTEAMSTKAACQRALANLRY